MAQLVPSFGLAAFGRGALLASLALLVGCEELPPCTWESCPVCFADATVDRVNVTVQGPDEQMYSVPFRIARADVAFDSQALPSQALGIILEEKLGIAVEYTSAFDDWQMMYSMLNCADWANYLCNEQALTLEDGARLAREGLKVNPDPLPDVFLGVEIWPNTADNDNLGVDAEIWDARGAANLGPAGYVYKEMFFVLPESEAVMWQEEAQVLSNWHVWTTEIVTRYVSTPQAYMDAGVGTAFPGQCPGDPNVTESIQPEIEKLVKLGYVCVDDWWLTPACAATGDQWRTSCAAVLDDFWGYKKPELDRALSELGMRVAQVKVGNSEKIDVLMSRKFNSSYLHWDTDTITGFLKPLGVQLPLHLDTESRIVQTYGWAPAVKSNKKLDTLLSQYSLSNSIMSSMLEQVADAVRQGQGPGIGQNPNYFQKLACDWLRSNEDVWTRWLPNPKSCSAGEVFHAELQQCRPCPAGTAAIAGVCQPCPVGESQPLSGQLECVACEPGRHGPETGLKECVACGIGDFIDHEGKSACVSCAEGTARPELWTSLRSIELADGSVQWFPTEGADNRSSCGCKPGAWLNRLADGSDSCEPCKKGMSCSGGPSYAVEPGFFTLASAPLGFYQCLNPKDCPGGHPESCAGDRIGLLCQSCPDGEGPADNFACRPCSGAGVGFLVLAALAWLVYCFIANWAQVQEIPARMPAHTALAVASIMFVTLQQMLGIVGGAPAEWPEEMKPLLAFADSFLFEVGFFDLRCSAGTSDLLHYSARAGMFLYIFAGIWLCYLLSQVAPRFAWSWRATVNLTGSTLLVFFTTLVAVAAIPMSCYPHPNAKLSVRAYPAVICGDPDHATLLVIGILLFLFAVGFIGALVWAAWHVPAWCQDGKHDNLRMVAFLVSNYQAEAWYWGIVRSIRSMLLAVTAIAFPSDALAQLFSMCTVFIVTGIAQMHLWPWKSHILNWADAVVAFGMALVLSLGIAYTGHEGEGIPVSFAAAMTFMASSLMAMIVIVILFFLWTALRMPAPRLSSIDEDGAAEVWIQLANMVANQSKEVLAQIFCEIAEYDLELLVKTTSLMRACGLDEAEASQGKAKAMRLKPKSSSRLSPSSLSCSTLSTPADAGVDSESSV